MVAARRWLEAIGRTMLPNAEQHYHTLLQIAKPWLRLVVCKFLGIKNLGVAQKILVTYLQHCCYNYRDYVTKSQKNLSWQ